MFERMHGALEAVFNAHSANIPFLLFDFVGLIMNQSSIIVSNSVHNDESNDMVSCSFYHIHPHGLLCFTSWKYLGNGLTSQQLTHDS